MQDDQSKISLKLSGLFRDRFEIHEKIGSGSTGTAYKAKDKSLDRNLAIKVLNSDRLSEKDVVKLHREARTTCKLKHPSIVEIFDFILTDDNRPVMVMEYVEGNSLERFVEEKGPLPLDSAIPLFIRICEAMEYAHNQGVLHRDLTPGNIIVRTTPSALEIKILDFGIAKIDRIEDVRISHSGVLIGTVTVISPEQARGQETDARSDVYSLGCLMFKVLTGKYPFDGDTPLEIAYLQVNAKPPALGSVTFGKHFPVEMEAIISKALEKSPEKRFKSMKDLQEQLESVEFGAIEEEGSEVKSEELQLFGDSAKTSTKTAVVRGNSIAPLVVSALIFVAIIGALLSFLATAPSPTDTHTFAGDQHKLLTLGGLPLSASEESDWYTQNDQKWRRVHKRLDDRVLMELIDPKHADVKRINMRGASFDSGGLRKLLDLKIVGLDLRDTELDDRSLSLIAQYPSVQALMISGCKKVTNQGILALAQLPQLTTLTAGGTGINNDAVPVLATMRSLKHLNIEDNKQITDEAVYPLIASQHLESLDVSATAISPKGVKLLLVHPSKIVLLTVADLDLTDSVVDPSAIRPDFHFLDFAKNRFTGKVFGVLRNLYELWILNVNDCPAITEQDIKNYGKTLYGRRVLIPTAEMITNNTEWYLEPTWYQLSWDARFARMKIFSNMERLLNE